MRRLLDGAVVGFLFVTACASGREYVYYTVHPETDKLIGKDKDLRLSETCTPDPACHENGKPCNLCVALTVPEFFAMYQELEELRKALKECQQGPPPKISVF